MNVYNKVFFFSDHRISRMIRYEQITPQNVRCETKQNNKLAFKFDFTTMKGRKENLEQRSQRERRYVVLSFILMCRKEDKH